MTITDIMHYMAAPYTTGGGSIEEGFDCWTLLKDIYKHQLNVEIPDLPHININDVYSLRENITNEKAIRSDWLLLDSPVNLCAVAMSKFNRCVHHVGVFIDIDGGKVLHTSPGIGVSFVKLNIIKKDFKTVKYYGLRN